MPRAEERGDEGRRRLEREARYETGLAALLECLRDGHAPSAFDGVTVVRLQNVEMAVRFGLCPRCRLCYWTPDKAAEDRALRRAQEEQAAEAHARELEETIRENERRGGGTYRPFPGPRWTR